MLVGAVIDPLRWPHEIVLHKILQALHTPGTDDVKKALTEIRKESAHATACHNLAPCVSEEIGQLPHSIKVFLQASEKYEIELLDVTSIEGPMVQFMVQFDIEPNGFQNGSDVHACHGLHGIVVCSCASIDGQMCAYDKGALP